MLTRSMLKGMGLTEEQISAIIDAHKDTVDALKEQRDAYKADAEKLPTVQKELDNIRNGKDWEAEYNKEHEAFETYKKDVAGKETLTAVKGAFRKLLLEKKIDAADADLIMAGTDYSGMKLDGNGGLADADSIGKNIEEKYARYIPTVDSKGTPPANPPKNDGSGDYAAEIRALTDKWHAARYGEPKKE